MVVLLTLDQPVVGSNPTSPANLLGGENVRYSREIKEFFGFVRKGLPLTIAIIVIILILSFIGHLLPPLALIIAGFFGILFSTAALGIIKDIADND